MDDQSIIELYSRRDENAVSETEAKYGAYCLSIAYGILQNHEDAEECVNDAWMTAWNKIPTVNPDSLKAFLGKIVRDVALSRFRANHAQKRYNGMEVMLDELEECIPSAFDVQEKLEQQELSNLIDGWLASLSSEDRVAFIRRYYFGESVKSIAKLCACTENRMAQKMMKLRIGLKAFLTANEVSI